MKEKPQINWSHVLALNQYYWYDKKLKRKYSMSSFKWAVIKIDIDLMKIWFCMCRNFNFLLLKSSNNLFIQFSFLLFLFVRYIEKIWKTTWEKLNLNSNKIHPQKKGKRNIQVHLISITRAKALRNFHNIDFSVPHKSKIEGKWKNFFLFVVFIWMFHKKIWIFYCFSLD